MIDLFEIQNGKVMPTKHCFAISWLNVLIEKYPEHCNQMFAYIFYKSYHGSQNPFFNLESGYVKEAEILDAIKPDFSLDNPDLIIAIEKASLLYLTPLARLHKSLLTMVDHISNHIETNKITTGRDGNLASFLRLGKEIDAVRKNIKALGKDLEEEQNSGRARGNLDLAYDQK